LFQAIVRTAEAPPQAVGWRNVEFASQHETESTDEEGLPD